MQPPEHHRVDDIVVQPQSAGGVDIDPALEPCAHLHRGVVGQAHQVFDRPELTQIASARFAGIGAAARHPVHHALGDQVLKRPSYGLPRQAMPFNEFRLSGQPGAVSVVARGDLAAKPVAKRLIRGLGPH